MRYQVSASTRPAPSAAWQLRMWSKKHSESRIDGGRGIGAINVTSSRRTTSDAESQCLLAGLPQPVGAAADQVQQRHARRHRVDRVAGEHPGAFAVSALDR